MIMHAPGSLFRRFPIVEGQAASSPPVLYLSGPIMGVPDHVRDFRFAADHFSRAGYAVVDPHDVMACPGIGCEDARAFGRSPVSPGGHTWQCYLRHDIRRMLECDAVIMLSGWASSQGAKLEFHVALSCGLPVYNETGEFGMTEY